MIDILVAIAALGSIVAGVWDLFTTEVPDEVPALMISSGLFLHFLNAGMTGNFYPLTLSLVIGTILLGLGLLMYSKGQWGGADAWILAAIGYLVPLYGNNDIFMIDYLLNFLLVSAAYMVVYSLIVGARSKGTLGYFRKELRSRAKIVAAIPGVYLVFVVAMLSIFGAERYNFLPLIYTFLLVLLLTVFWVYGKVIEKYAFRKKIPANKVRVGDVLDNMLWRGLTEEEVAKLHKSKKEVVIKEGIRFVPVFPITLLVTLFYGNIFLALLF